MASLMFVLLVGAGYWGAWYVFGWQPFKRITWTVDDKTLLGIVSDDGIVPEWVRYIDMESHAKLPKPRSGK